MIYNQVRLDNLHEFVFMVPLIQNKIFVYFYINFSHFFILFTSTYTCNYKLQLFRLMQKCVFVHVSLTYKLHKNRYMYIKMFECTSMTTLTLNSGWQTDGISLKLPYTFPLLLGVFCFLSLFLKTKSTLNQYQRNLTYSTTQHNMQLKINNALDL